MKEDRKIKLSIWSILLVSSILVAILILLHSQDTRIGLLAILPFIYGCMVSISGAGRNYIDQYSPGITIVNLLYYVKSVVYPYAQVLSNDSYIRSTALTEAVLLTAVEIVVIYTVYWWMKQWEGIAKYPLKEYTVEDRMGTSRVILSAFLILTVVLVLKNRSVLNSYNLFTVSSLQTIGEKSDLNTSSSWLSVMVGWGKIIVPVVVCQWCYKRYVKEKRTAYIVVAFTVVCLMATIVEGVSRSSFVVPAVCGFFLLLRLFPEKSKSITIFFGIALMTIFVTFTITRFGSFWGSQGSGINGITKTLQGYLCGLKNMMVSIGARDAYGADIGFSNLLSDLLGNWMGIGKMFRTSWSIGDIFNLAYYGNRIAFDQIVPTVGQAYIQFGSLFSYLYTIPMVVILMKCDGRYRSERRIDFSYLYLFASVKCAITLMGNFRIFMATFLNILLPLYIIFLINYHFVLRKKK